MINDEFIIIIPARRKSTRLKDKMLLDVLGKPLIVKTAQQAKKSNAKRVVVATDDLDIQKVCFDADIEVIMTNENHLTGTDRLAQAAEILGLKHNEIVINIQGDEPLIPVALINNLARCAKESTQDVITVAHKISDNSMLNNPNIVKVVVNKFFEALYFSRACIPYDRDNIFNNKTNLVVQNFEYLRHIGAYAYKVKFLLNYKNLTYTILEDLEKLEQLRVLYHGYKILVHITDLALHRGVDTVEDLEYVREVSALAGM